MEKKLTWNIAFSQIIAIFCLFFPLSTFGVLGRSFHLPPHADYHVLSTQHFEIVYPKILEKQTKYVAAISEESHTILSKEFQYTPSRKVTILLTDNQDSANGAATAIGHQGLVLILTPPDPYSSIGEYDNWIRELFIHEYTHYLTLDQARGLFNFTRYLFGDLLLPNHLWPNWLAEGLAVYAETQFTTQGRGRSAYFSTITRDFFHRKKLFPAFDDLMGPYPEFPHGGLAYYAGNGIVEQLVHEKGKDSPALFARGSSYRVPFFLNGTLDSVAFTSEPLTLEPLTFSPAPSVQVARPTRKRSRENIGGNNFKTLWENWILSEKDRLKNDLEWLEKHATPEPKILSPIGEATLGARLSPDESMLAYILDVSGHEFPALYLIDLKFNKKQKLDEMVANAGLAFSKDSKTLYYSKHEFDGPYTFHSELYAMDLETKTSQKLTFGERAKDPALCGQDLLVFTTHHSPTSKLKILNLKTKKIHTLYTAQDYDAIANPRCTNDYVFFSLHSTHAHYTIYMLSLHKPSTPTHLLGGSLDNTSALFPEPDEMGNLYFTKIQNQFYELAKLDFKTRKISRLAKSSGGYWLPSVTQNLVAVTYLSSNGIQAGVFEKKVLENKAIAIPQEQKEKILIPQKSTPTPELTAHQISSYSLFNSLPPRIWSPLITYSNSQRQFGWTFIGWDDLEQLSYQLSLWYDVFPRKPGGLLSTTHQISTFELQLLGGSHVIDPFTFDEQRLLSSRLARPIPGVTIKITPAILFEWSKIINSSYRIGGAFGMDSRKQYTASLSKETGWAFSLEGRRFFSGSDRASKAQLHANALFPLYPQHSVLSLNGFLATTPKFTAEIPDSLVEIGGQGDSTNLNPPLRGYPANQFETLRGAVFQAEYRLPLFQFFRGFDTFPLFLRNLGAFGFYDGAKILERNGKYSRIIGGVGGGLLLNTVLGYYAPFQLRLEYAKGLLPERLGQDVFSVLMTF